MTNPGPVADRPPPPTCVVCGYDLRAAPVDGECPECGSDVDRSLHGHWLRYCDQRWVESLQRGLDWIWWSLGTLLFVFAAAVLLGLPAVFFLDEGLFESGPGQWSLFALVVVCYLGLALAAIGLPAGVWLLSTPEPQTVASEPLRPRALRALTIALLPAMAVAILEQGPSPILIGVPGWAGMVIVAAVPVLIGAHGYLVIVQLRSIEQRCCDYDDARARVLEKYRRGVRGFTLAIALGSLSLFALMGIGFGANGMMIVWLAALSQTGETRKRICKELALYGAQSGRTVT